MLTLLFKLSVLVLFVLESVLVFIINNAIDYQNGEPSHKVAFYLISGLIIRAYMLYCMLSGMGLINVG